MPDVVTTYSQVSNDALTYWIAGEMIALADRNLVLGGLSKKHQLPQRMGTSLRVIRYKRFDLPAAPLTEGVTPDAVPLQNEHVTVALEQWGIVGILTDVAEITTTHPALTAMIDRSSLAMAETLERETATVLMSGTSVLYPGTVTARSGLAASDKMTTPAVLKCIARLRAIAAPMYPQQLYRGVMAPQQEADLLGTDTVFQQARNFSNVRELDMAEIGTWMGAKWQRSNFLPVFVGVATPDTGAATATKAQYAVVVGGGSLAAGNYVLKVVARSARTGYEHKVSQTSGNVVAALNDRITVTTPSSTSYVYDLYMSQVGGAILYKVASRVAASTATTFSTQPAGTEAVAPVAPTSATEVFVAWLFGRDAFGTVELNGMSLQSYLTNKGASDSDPLAQRRKVGAKVMWKSFILDNDFFVRLETGSSFPSTLAA